jgi:hypothetical protein
MRKEFFVFATLLILIGILLMGWRLQTVKDDAKANAEQVTCEAYYGRFDPRCS